MQFQVPQFIETEDKIIGPLTIRQFIYIAVAGGISAILYFVVQTWLWAFLSLLLLSIAISFAFIKIEGRPLAHIAISALSFYWRPQTYVWQPEHPQMPKSAESMKKLETPGFSLESIIRGLALHKTWQDLQTGTKAKPMFGKKVSERYEIFRRLSGEKQAARRVDYR